MLSCSPAEDALPAWFVDALGDPGTDRTAVAAGATIHYRVWGPADGEALVLVHGGAAHAGWWDHIAPLLAVGRRVVALDLSGHGSSDARTEYGFETWADEVLAVAELEGNGSPVVVGHSMGGVVALTTAHRHASRFAGALVIDAPDWLLKGRVPPSPAELPPRRHYATRAQAEARFRARPADPARLSYVEGHVASRSVREGETGWSWRFDHTVTTHGTVPGDMWDSAHCPVVLIVAERGMLTGDEQRELVDRLGGAPIVTVRDSGHHIMLDQPTVLVGIIEGTLAGWAR